ncbi:putative peptide maturation dehydrogenase [Lysobacter solisilvae (ex Woo and Kim 2020)]|uniref:Putative peptide maturation dehydrogenase n=1 Tax=Agrilutibacter terrestris TaxID=2865112 RepID=A0A7H0G0P1_9GAMM|nr:putative peptide maturation dehydrogenase [Lysobacter terrestris]QNP41857.1 putative peptide maturation dehydrogenase [Lysobacter terrestris]
MKVRRCAVVYVEPREEVGFDLQELLNGGDGLRRERRWVALAPHLGEEVELDADERELLGALGPSQWLDAKALAAHPPGAVQRLLKEGLLIGDGKRHAAQRARDEALRATYWHPLAATLHAFTRWSGVDAVQNMKDSGTETAVQMREVLGAPPTAAAHRGDGVAQLKLPRIEATDFDRLLARRATCRNFDPGRALPFDLFAQLLQRVFAAQAEVRISADTVFLKKNVPSGGGLHPIECYLVVQHVEGVAPGLYHYQAVDHALEPLPVPAGRDWRDGGLRGFLQDMVAQQHWFADAHVAVVLAPRFDRTFWKYRQHAKGYRVVALEAGHLSQTLYLSATEAGLGAFITGAINEKELERALGLDPVNQGALAVCGFGWRGEHMVTAELDPAGAVWLPAGA